MLEETSTEHQIGKGMRIELEHEVPIFNLVTIIKLISLI